MCPRPGAERDWGPLGPGAGRPLPCQAACSMCITLHGAFSFVQIPVDPLKIITQMIKNTSPKSSKNHPNQHVLRYLDILIDIHEKRFMEFQEGMEREFLDRRNDA